MVTMPTVKMTAQLSKGAGNRSSMVKRTLFSSLALGAVLLFVLTACSSPTAAPAPTSAPSTGTVEIRVTDAPPQGVTKVMIAATSIEAQRSNAQGESGWVTIVENPPVFDLVAVTGLEQVLGSDKLSEGSYGQVRLQIKSVTVTLQGKDMQASVPGDKLRVVGGFQVDAGKTTVLTLDFDADKSVVIAGPNVQFKPVVKLLTQQPTDKPEPPKKSASVPTSTYPMIVTDFLGRSVQIPQKPTRIVSVHPTSTEMLYRVGGTAVGRDTSSRYPQDVNSLPAVGSAYALNTEAIAALKPDLIIIEAITQARLLSSLEKLGAPVLAVRAASLDDVTKGLALVGKVVDSNKAAADAASGIQSRIDAAKKLVTKQSSLIILISDADRNIYAAKTESYPGTLAALLGQKNLAASLPESGPYPGFALFTGEQALASKPDLILTISPAPAPAPKLSAMLPQVPGFNQLDAVKNQRVKEIDPVLFLQAQGPRIEEAVEQMAQILKESAP